MTLLTEQFPLHNRFDNARVKFHSCNSFHRKAICEKIGKSPPIFPSITGRCIQQGNKLQIHS